MLTAILDMGLLRFCAASLVVAATMWLWLMIGALGLPMLVEG